MLTRCECFFPAYFRQISLHLFVIYCDAKGALMCRWDIFSHVAGSAPLFWLMKKGKSWHWFNTHLFVGSLRQLDAAICGCARSSRRTNKQKIERCQEKLVNKYLAYQVCSVQPLLPTVAVLFSVVRTARKRRFETDRRRIGGGPVAIHVRPLRAIVHLRVGSAQSHVQQPFEATNAAALVHVVPPPVLEHQPLGVAREDAHRRPSVHVRHVRQAVHAERKPQRSPADARRTAAVRLRHLRPAVCQ